MNRARRPLKSKREIYQLGAAKANGFIDMDTLSDARPEQVPMRLFFIRTHLFISICDNLNAEEGRLDIVTMPEYTCPEWEPCT